MKTIKFLFLFGVFFFFYCATTKSYEKKEMTLCVKGDDLLRGANYNHAIEIFNGILKKNGESLCALRGLGLIYQTMNQDELAVEYYEKALDVNPDLIKIHDDLGLIYQRLGKTEKAKEHFKIACEKGVSVACSDLKKWATKPENPHKEGTSDYYYQEGKNLQGVGNYDGAIEAFKKAIEKDPKHYLALESLGYELEMKGQLEEALKYYLTASEIKPDYANVYDNLGFVYKKLNRLKESKEAFTKACSLGIQGACQDAGVSSGNMPLDPSLRPSFLEGEDFLKNGEFDKAIDSFNKTMLSEPEHFLIHYKLGEAYLKKGLYKLAIAHLERAITINPSHKGSYHLISICFNKTKNKEKEKETKELSCLLGNKEDCTK